MDTLTNSTDGPRSVAHQLLACLSNGAAPVFVSAEDAVLAAASLVFPLWEVLEPLWRRSVIFLPRTRLPYLVKLLSSIHFNTRVEMNRQVSSTIYPFLLSCSSLHRSNIRVFSRFKGRILWQRHFSTPEAQLATIFLALSRRMGLPQPPAPLAPSQPILLTGGLQPSSDAGATYLPRREVLAQVDVDDFLGPLGPPMDSPLFAQSSLSQFVYDRHRQHDLVDPFWSHSSTPWDLPLLPTEFQFLATDGSSNTVLCYRKKALYKNDQPNSIY